MGNIGKQQIFGVFREQVDWTVGSWRMGMGCQGMSVGKMVEGQSCPTRPLPFVELNSLKAGCYWATLADKNPYHSSHFMQVKKEDPIGFPKATIPSSHSYDLLRHMVWIMEGWDESDKFLQSPLTYLNAILLFCALLLFFCYLF
jgi:hypothetical protein